ncbi:MAG: patatin-like phospholipase family protein [Desulfobaccales bacterium]
MPREESLANFEGKRRANSAGRGFLALVGLALCGLLLQGCVALQARHPLPEDLEDQAQVAGFPNVRAWGDVYSESLQESGIESVKQELAANHGKLDPEVSFLLLSGGGGDGAFGAGILCGWTAAGTRPQFKLVTGISTGALIAPFAFLGPEYDPKLKAAYTTISDKDIYTVPSKLKLLINLGRIESVANTEPLAKLLERLIDEKMLQAIAAEHNKGRRLLVGTTQLDAQRLVIWNMGALAASGRPDALKLFRRILRASASIPVAFNPVYIKVQAGGQEYDEMHVDGGVMAEVMLYENAISFLTARKELGSLISNRSRHVYIIRNAQIYPEYESVKPKIGSIGARAITSLTKSQGMGDLYRIYVLALRDELDYNLAFIPKDFHPKRASEFDTNYMDQEFNMAYNLASSGYQWSKWPPGFVPANLHPISGQQVQP